MSMRNHPSDNERLESSAQQAMRAVVQALPDEEPSLAWRSALNERLLETAAQSRRRQRVVWFLRPALGLGLAGALAAVVMLRTSPEPRSLPTVQDGAGIEAELLATHRQSTNFVDVAGAGLDADEASYVGTPAVNPIWNEADIESL